MDKGGQENSKGSLVIGEARVGRRKVRVGSRNRGIEGKE
jgi:hypothetical protein